MNYLPEYKNPCWFEGDESANGLRCLPYFYLLGVAKSGTGSTFTQLKKHPNIFMARNKELYFWHLPKKSKTSKF